MMGINSHCKVNVTTCLFCVDCSHASMQNITKKGVFLIFRASEGRGHNKLSWPTP